MCGSLFWGVLLILFGASIILNIIFGINLPLAKIFIATLLIAWGIKLLVPRQKNQCNIFFESSVLDSNCNKERYTICFGSGLIDLRTIASQSLPKKVTISTQFANATVILPPNVPVRVKSNVTFSSVQLPNLQTGGEYTNLHGSSEPLLTVVIDAVFSSVNVKE